MLRKNRQEEDNKRRDEIEGIDLMESGRYRPRAQLQCSAG